MVRRIVSLVPSTTESVCAFGRADALVGCTRYCVEPPAALVDVMRLGGTKNPRLDAIAALEPDLVLANAEENRPEDIEWLGRRLPMLVQTPCTVADALVCLRELSVALDAASAASPWISRIERAIGAPPIEPPLRVFFAIWKKPWMSINATTFVHDVLRSVGAVNVCAELPARYPEVAVDWIREQRPDAVLLPSEPWEFTAAERSELLAARTFDGAVIALCDGRDFCWHGVRMADGIERARQAVAGVRR